MTDSKHVSSDQRHIVAIGGGILAPEVLKYTFALTGKPVPRVLVITTATGDSTESLVRMLSKMAILPCEVRTLGFFARTPPNLEELILSHDVVFVGGGNTKSMLAVWREYGVDKILREAWRRGIVLAGSSAGGICWFDVCITDSWDVEYTTLPALGFLKGSCCPHYDGEVGRRPLYHRLIKETPLPAGWAIDEGVGMHFVDQKLLQVVTPKPNGAAYGVWRTADGDVTEVKMKAVFIGDK
jgi:dipeptidase E